MVYIAFSRYKWNARVRFVSPIFSYFFSIYLVLRPYKPALNLRTKQRRNIVRDLRKVSSEIVCVITFWRGSSGPMPKIRIFFPVPWTPVTGQYPTRGKDKERNRSVDGKENKECNRTNSPNVRTYVSLGDDRWIEDRSERNFDSETCSAILNAYITFNLERAESCWKRNPKIVWKLEDSQHASV